MRSILDIFLGAMIACLFVNGVLLFGAADRAALFPFIMCAVATFLLISSRR